MTWSVLQGDCVEVMAEMAEASVDAIVCDPPYELGFMGKQWDASGVAYRLETWRNAWRVLKPGGHLLAFGGTRTYHRLTCAIEDAGFEIRDCLAWMYGSGFPKSLDVSKALDKAAGAEREVVGTVKKLESYGPNEVYGDGPDHGGMMSVTAPATPDAEQWQGWGTALKPAFEPIVMARKPLTGTVAANVLAHGTGALNIDGTRIDSGDEEVPTFDNLGRESHGIYADGLQGSKQTGRTANYGRWPANVILDDEAAAMLDEQSGERVGSKPGTLYATPRYTGNAYNNGEEGGGQKEFGYGDTGGASRFFYTAKVSRAERNRGLEHAPQTIRDSAVRRAEQDNPDRPGQERVPTGNTHPTVKPVDLMQWLCRLVTPPNGTVLDPFTGSGSTGIAALREGFDFIGIEREPEYVEIAKARIIGDAPLFNVGTEAV